MTITMRRIALGAAAGLLAIGVGAGAFVHAQDQTANPPARPSRGGPGAPGELPPGVYRYSVSTAELRALGETEHDATMNAGVLTWTLRGGSWSSQIPGELTPDRQNRDNANAIYVFALGER